MKKTFLVLWRIWFYILSTIPVLVLFIPLALFLTIPNGYKNLYWIARNIWAPFVLFGMGFWIKRLNSFPEESKSMVLVANHTSYIDIMLMFRMRKTPFVFVGKKELIKIPFFGYLYKRAAITVDRSSLKSRKQVYESARKVILKGYSICIFPEKDYLEEKVLLNSFKKGAFKLAIEHQLPVFPIVFYDCKRKFPWHTDYGYFGILRVKGLNLVKTKGMSEKNIIPLTLRIHNQIKNELMNDPKQVAIKAIRLWESIKH
ncbi:MAG: hypothetical protein CBD39_03895 [Flavobacteriaceae bacterium TMED179]|nr:MAG: hypothetical protein CBD39_03895 [Flavobacteriaceae bacterium TMED179]|tara:strand:- start:523 stop:1296 length:774 start_codon:yes stop_codon:yes gene_type:complete